MPDSFLACGRIPAWKRLIDHPLGTNERISLITYIFDSDETEAVKNLRGDDAQLFVDVVDEVFSHSFASEGSADLNLNLPVLPSRCWID